MHSKEPTLPRAAIATRDIVVGIGAAIGLAVVGLTLWRLMPLERSLDEIRGRGEVARALAKPAPAPADEARVAAAFRSARDEIDRVFAQKRGALGPALAPGERWSMTERLDAVAAWGELRVAWARAISAQGLSSAEFFARAKAPGAGRVYDRLLEAIGEKAG